jgi:hypothetical protein
VRRPVHEKSVPDKFVPPFREGQGDMAVLSDDRVARRDAWCATCCISKQVRDLVLAPERPAVAWQTVQNFERERVYRDLDDPIDGQPTHRVLSASCEHLSRRRSAPRMAVA